MLEIASLLSGKRVVQIWLHFLDYGTSWLNFFSRLFFSEFLLVFEDTVVIPKVCQVDLQELRYFNLFHAIIYFYTSRKHQKNLWFSNIFRGYRNRLVAWNGLNSISVLTLFFQMFSGGSKVNTGKKRVNSSVMELCI